MNNRITLSFSEGLQRTSRTLRLLPFPSFVVPPQPPPFKTLLRDSERTLSLRRQERRVGGELEVKADLRG